MKDLPHHMKKLNRRIVRTERRMQIEDEEYIEPPKQARPKKQMQKPVKAARKKAEEPELAELPREKTVRPKKQVRKQAKATMRKEREARVPVKKTAEERNWEMKKRVPIFDKNKMKPKVGARASKKKRPRI